MKRTVVFALTRLSGLGALERIWTLSQKWKTSTDEGVGAESREDEGYVNLGIHLPEETEHLFTLELVKSIPKAKLEDQLKEIGFTEITFLADDGKSEDEVGAARGARSGQGKRGNARVTFTAKTRVPGHLHNTPSSSWKRVWRVHTNPSAPIQIVPRLFSFVKDQAYEVRFVSIDQTRGSARARLKTIGFADMTDALPILLRAHIRHPALHGDLNEWLFQGVFTGSSKTLQHPNGVLIEEVASIT